MQSYVTPHIEGKRYTNIGGSWAATIFSVKFHFFFYSVVPVDTPGQTMDLWIEFYFTLSE